MKKLSRNFAIRENELSNCLNKMLIDEKSFINFVFNDKNAGYSGLDSDRKYLVLHIYTILWGDIFEVDTKSVRRGKIITSNGKITYSGDTLNTYNTTFGKNNDKFKSVHERDNFKNTYHTIGNFMPVIQKINSFQSRGLDSQIKDYFDLSLIAIKEWYMTGESEFMFISNSKEYFDIFKDKSADGWNNFVEKNFLQPFMEEQKEGGSYVPKLFWEKHSFENNIPNSDEQVKDYITTASECIRQRGKIMYQALCKNAKKLKVKN